jgi:hypothetical protein
MLHIFAYGVLSDYKGEHIFKCWMIGKAAEDILTDSISCAMSLEHAATLPGLSSTQLTKLKLLTLVDLASKHQSLSYSKRTSCRREW